MDLDELSDFVLVATHGGYAQASRSSGRSKATLSRKVLALEASLGVRLFERGTRSVHLTTTGPTLRGGPYFKKKLRGSAYERHELKWLK